MQEITINGLRFKYERDRDLFNYLLKINGVTKKKFCKKFGLSYSYVNAWGSTTKEKSIKFPSWVFHYLKDVMYYKIEAIKIKLPLSVLYHRLQHGETLTDLYKEVSLSFNQNLEDDSGILIPDEVKLEQEHYIFDLSKSL